MNTSKISILSSILLCTTLVLPAAAASTRQVPGQRSPLQHYVLFDVGSFGGGFSGFCYPNCRQLNSKSVGVGISATALADPFDPDCFYDCHADHAFLSRRRNAPKDLSALQDSVSSWGQGINDKGAVAGISQNGDIDPATGFWETRAVLWKHGSIKDLGTLGGTQSNAWMVNNAGRGVADSLTSDSNDPYINVPQANCRWLPTTGTNCGELDFGTNTIFFPLTTAVHGATWTKAAQTLADVGTLGGPDSSAIDINDAGQIVGWSYVSYTAGSAGVPDTQAFIWDKKNGMNSLPGLGGTFTAAEQINQNGQISGLANTANDAELHAVVWDADQSHPIHDRGTLGSDYAHPDWMNDAADIVGFSRNASSQGRAFVYWHDGNHMIDLGTIGSDPESEATGINNNGMIVGLTFDRDVGDLKGWVSDNGGPITDLNTVVKRAHGLHINTANSINDRGVIAANATDRDGAPHAVVLVPESALDVIAEMEVAMKQMPPAAQPVSRAKAMRVAKPNCGARVGLRPAICRRG